jgi:multiple sugar transport system ATP-binding protein
VVVPRLRWKCCSSSRATVREPDVFLLDEPLSNLDAKLRTSARDELQHFQRNLGTTTIYVTHDQIEAMGLGHRIAVMNKGKVRQLGPPQEVYNEPADTFVAGFLGSPPMNFFERGDAIVGFRPEHLLPRGAYSTQEPLVHLWFRVTRVEYLGADRLLYGNLRDLAPDAKMIVNVPSTVFLSVTEGESYEFSIKKSDVKFFDKSTGLRTAPRPFWSGG